MSRTFAAIAALTIFASSAASAQMLKTADTPKGKTFVDAKGMTAVYLRQRRRRQVDVQRYLRRKLAAARSRR